MSLDIDQETTLGKKSGGPGQVCPICTDDIEDGEDVRTFNKCGHVLHSECMENLFKTSKHSVKCPVCSEIYGIPHGNQPDGTITIYTSSAPHLQGYPSDVETIVIEFDIPDGVQDDTMINPGKNFTGTFRTAYLPYDEDGYTVCMLMWAAWERKLMFTVGNSLTTGRENVVVMNGIHLKTSSRGGATNYGYPDDDYFFRVKDELKVKGVTMEDVKGITIPIAPPLSMAPPPAAVPPLPPIISRIRKVFTPFVLANGIPPLPPIISRIRKVFTPFGLVNGIPPPPPIMARQRRAFTQIPPLGLRIAIRRGSGVRVPSRQLSTPPTFYVSPGVVKTLTSHSRSAPQPAANAKPSVSALAGANPPAPPARNPPNFGGAAAPSRPSASSSSTKVVEIWEMHESVERHIQAFATANPELSPDITRVIVSMQTQPNTMDVLIRDEEYPIAVHKQIVQELLAEIPSVFHRLNYGNIPIDQHGELIRESFRLINMLEPSPIKDHILNLYKIYEEEPQKYDSIKLYADGTGMRSLVKIKNGTATEYDVGRSLLVNSVIFSLPPLPVPMKCYRGVDPYYQTDFPDEMRGGKVPGSVLKRNAFPHSVSPSLEICLRFMGNRECCMFEITFDAGVQLGFNVALFQFILPGGSALIYESGPEMRTVSGKMLKFYRLHYVPTRP